MFILRVHLLQGELRRDPTHWGANPEGAIPERVDSSELMEAKTHETLAEGKRVVA